MVAMGTRREAEPETIFQNRDITARLDDWTVHPVVLRENDLRQRQALQGVLREAIATIKELRRQLELKK
jgi:hypothetical protein